MTQDEVLQTLRKVIAEFDNFKTLTVSTTHLVELVKRAVEAEREACAKVCEKVAVDYYTRIEREHEPYMRATAEGCARNIRARAQPEERNFCPRCGNRTADLITIHTCTPP